MTGPSGMGAVAVIGMSGRFPGAASLSEFWENLRDGKESISRFGAEELRSSGADEALVLDGNYVKAAGVLDNIEGFDSEFFGFRPREAEMMDPQHRIFLECAWEALEDAGYGTREAGLEVGVFASASLSTYLLFNLAHRLDVSGADFNLATLIGNDKDYLATMTAYKLDLRGPTLSVQTACSSSLIAVHQACQALINGECDLSLAGGVTVRVPHRVGYLHQGGSMLSPDGHCRAFDDEACGTVPGSGAGVVVLKRLADAIAARDCIRAVILGSAINNDGASKAGFTAPNVDGQASVIATAHAVAGADPRTIGYVEAHGTGTRLGDPIEIQAIAKAFAATPDRQFCAIGSVKTNIGHLECAAGIAGLIKTVLMLENSQIVPSLHFKRGNEQIEFGQSPVYVNTSLTEWKTPLPRRAGVSSFGFGGANCHIVMEEAPIPETVPRENDRPVHLLAISARSEAALAELSSRYVRFLNGAPQSSIADISYTANVGRHAFEWRKVAMGSTAREMAEAIQSAPAFRDVKRPRIAFLFPAGNATCTAIARELYRTQSSFRKAVDRCDEVVRSGFGRSLVAALEMRGTEVPEPRLVLPALFALECGLADLWHNWGVEPDFVLGEGVGECVAAYVAGMLTLEDGLKRAAQLGERLKPAVRTVASGYGSGALFHESVEWDSNGGKAVYAKPRIPFASVRAGAFVGPGDSIAADWQLPDTNSAARRAALRTIADAGATVFVEVGPGTTLSESGRESLPQPVFSWLGGICHGHEWRDLLGCLSTMFTLGIGADWDGFDRDYERRRVPLPTYPFQRKRYWVTPPRRDFSKQTGPPTHPLLGRVIDMASGQHVFHSEIEAAETHFLTDHRVRGVAVFPLTAYIEAALSAACKVFGKRHGLAVSALEIDEPLMIPEIGTCVVQSVVTPNERTGEAAFELFQRSERLPWQRHASGMLQAHISNPTSGNSLQAARDACHTEIAVDRFYDGLRQAGMDYGPRFRTVRQIWQGERQALALVTAEIDGVWLFHPALADGCLQAAGVLIAALEEGAAWLPVGVEATTFHKSCNGTVWSHASVRDRSATAITSDVQVFDMSGEIVAEFRGLRFRRGRFEPAAKAANDPCYEIAWQRLDSVRSNSRPSLPGTWLLFADAGELGATAAKGLADAGAKCFTVIPGERFECLGTSRYRIRADQRADYRRLIAEASVEPLAGVVHCWNLSALQDDVFAPDCGGCQGALLLSQALLETERRDGFRMCVVTSGAQCVGTADPAPVPVQALVWGLGRVLANEHPKLHCVLVDLEPGSSHAAGMLLDDLALENPEEQLAYRARERFVPRLVRTGADRWLPDGPYDLPLPDGRVLGKLRCVAAAEARAPGDGQVGILVRATSLNFRDVLNSMGLYPGPAVLGTDCAGEIYAVGPGVTELAVGQPVVAVAPGSFASHVVADADFVAGLPPGVGFEEAAAIPTALLTAYYCLFEAGGLKKGQKVLIHAGAGGVGLAAVRMALSAGAQVFATAGTPEKREYLSRLGVAGAMDSRSLSFSAELLAATEGRGVDLVLNSLAGDFIAASLSVVCAGGLFLEIGKIGTWDEARVAAEYPQVSYRRIALDALMVSSRHALSQQFRHVVDRYLRTDRQPMPVSVFPMGKAADAFRFMQGARHIGKIVVSHPRGIRSDGTYLIAGGLGTLGLELAHALAGRGARSLTLVGRRSPSVRATEVIDKLRSNGVRVDCRQVDICKPNEVASLMASLAEGPPLRGIVHAAGARDDCALENLTRDRMAKVLAPKVAGAWNLHAASSQLPVDFFVLYSSASALLGPPGQASYAAANAFLDSLAYYRRSLGLPCLTINWGPWSSGMSATDVRRDFWSELGLVGIKPDQGHAFLDRFLRAGVLQATAIVVDWQRFLDRFSGGRHPALLRELAGACTRPGTSERSDGFLDGLDSLPADARLPALREKIRGLALQVLGRTSEPLDDHLSLIEFGFDSLMTVELRNALGSLIGARLPSTLVFDYPTINELSNYLAGEVFHWAPGPLSHALEPVRETRQACSTACLDDLSEQQLAEWVLREAEKWSTEI